MSSLETRTRKAWRVKVTWSDDSQIIFASNASKARSALRYDLLDSYSDIRFQDISALRARSYDQQLPAPHRIIAELTATDRQIILRAFGADRRRGEPGYRDYFCTSPGDPRLLRLAWELGIFRGPYGEQEYGETRGWVGAFYYLTEFGKHVALSMIPTYPGERTPSAEVAA